MALPGAEQRLELTQADALDYGSLVECFFGCDGVFHTSSPSDVISNYPVSYRFSLSGMQHIAMWFWFFLVMDNLICSRSYTSFGNWLSYLNNLSNRRGYSFLVLLLPWNLLQPSWKYQSSV